MLFVVSGCQERHCGIRAVDTRWKPWRCSCGHRACVCVCVCACAHLGSRINYRNTHMRSFRQEPLTFLRLLLKYLSYTPTKIHYGIVPPQSPLSILTSDQARKWCAYVRRPSLSQLSLLVRLTHLGTFETWVLIQGCTMTPPVTDTTTCESVSHCNAL